jgi:hypothetical protein
MKPEDVRVGMEFAMLDISSYWVHVEGIDGEDALCQYFTCFSGGKEKVRLRDLVNERVFRRIK